MPQDPFPDSGPGGQEEPDGSGPPPAAGGSGPDPAEGDFPPEWPEQGLYVCLPAGELTLAGFSQGGRADTMEPGPLLAAVAEAVTGQDGPGLSGLSDDQLVGIISAGRRLESRAAWIQMAAMAEFAARRPALSRPGVGTTADRAAEFAADELAGELHLTAQSAAGQIEHARVVADRLPQTFAAMRAGRIHQVHVRIIADEVSVLNDEALDLRAAAARRPATGWCVTAVAPDGTAAAHGCLPGRHPRPRPIRADIYHHASTYLT